MYVSFNGLGFPGGYKEAYIALRKAVSELKRRKPPSDCALEMLGYTVEDYNNSAEYMAAHEFEMKDRAAFIKRLNKEGVDVFDAGWLQMRLNRARELLDKEPDNEFYEACEMILGNLLYNKDQHI